MTNYEPYNQTYDDKLNVSINSIRCVFNKYNPDEIAISFNGGKDNTVMFDLILNTIEKYNYRMPFVFTVESDYDFPEIKKYISNIENKYNLNIYRFKGHIKESLYKMTKFRPQIKTIFIGKRKDDMNSYDLKKLSYYEYTDPDWPQFMRVFPLIFFDYHDVWKYLLDNNVQYCNLYDNGYTSIGTINNTLPNPALKYTENNKIKYYPAYKLKNPSDERKGRINKKRHGK